MSRVLPEIEHMARKVILQTLEVKRQSKKEAGCQAIGNRQNNKQ
jgi:hypothetical protein